MHHSTVIVTVSTSSAERFWGQVVPPYRRIVIAEYRISGVFVRTSQIVDASNFTFVILHSSSRRPDLTPIALPDLILDLVANSVRIGPLGAHPFQGIRNEECEEANAVPTQK
jgi:hypothetical protein